MVGTACAPELTRSGHLVQPLVREARPGGGLPWDVATGRVNLRDFSPDAVIHLAGENLASGRWTEARKARIHDSRVDATQKLCEFLAALPKPPRVLLSASAVGIYGDRGDKWLIEASPPSSDFLGSLCAQWERATEPLARASCRVVHLRFGIILSPSGGALGKMLPAFKMGVGGRLGDGRHWMSWIALSDLVRALEFLLVNPNAAGPINMVTPNPVPNAEFAQTLGRVLRRPALLPAPAPVLRLALGEFVDAALLASQRVRPGRLSDLGFEWKYPELEDALRAML